MPRSSRHKSHKQSKHSSKDYSDSEEDVIKVKDKSSKDDMSTRVRRDAASGEKRKFSSEVPEGKGTKDLADDRYGEMVEEHVSSRRRKEKEKEKERTDVSVGGDRWSGGGDDRGDSDKNGEKVGHKWDCLKAGSKLKENSNKGESLRIDSKSKSKRYESGSDERKDDGLASVLMDKEEGKSRGESKRRSERDSVTHKEGKESKDKDRRLDKERNGDEESKSGSDADMNVRNKKAEMGGFSEEKQGKRSRDIAEQTLQDEFCNTELEKEAERRMRRKREGSGEREKHHNDSKEGDERRSLSRLDRTKDLKYKDSKHKDGVYEDKYLEDGHKDERRRDERYREEADKDSKYHDDKYRDGDKNSRRRSDRHHDDGDRDGRRKDEKPRDDGERDSRRKDDRYREGVEREGRRDEKYEKYREDGDRDRRRKDGRYHEDGDKDDRHRDSSYRDDGNRGSRQKEEKYRDDIERDSRHKDSKHGDERDREKRPRDPKYRDERALRDHSSYRSDHKHGKYDDYAVDHHTLKSSAHENSPIQDDRTTKFQRTNEKEDYGESRSRGTKNQRFDTERIISSGAKTELTTDRTRAPKQDESRYGDYNYEERARHSMSSTVDHSSAFGGSEKPSQSLDKLSKKDDGQLGELSAEKRLKSDVRPSPSKLVDRSPSSSIDRRQFRRPDARRSNDVEESMQRSGGSRDWKEYSGKEGRVNRELNMDVIPGEEPLQADADTISVSSPFMRNSNFSNSSKSLAPPSFRTNLGSPSLSGSAEDEGRGKSNIHNRRTGDPNMGRIQGNPWGGVPSWPSPVANGFVSFPPHSFPSVMHPFPAPPMFGVRPSMEFDHPAPYHMPDADRFPGPMRPMGWGRQIDNSGTPMHSWDASNTVFGNESHVYGRPEWDHSRIVPGERGGETSGDLWRGPNRTRSMEMLYSEKENDSTRSGEVLGDSSDQPAPLTQSNQLAENKEIDELTQSSEKIDDEAPITSLEDRSDATKLSRNDDIRLCRAYLSKLDISADLTEPELLNECTGLIDTDPGTFSNVDDYKILSMEDEESEMASSRILSHKLFPPTDDSIFQKSMSLYRRQKEMFPAEDIEKLKLLIKFVPGSNQEDQDVVDNKTESKGVEEEDPENTQQKAKTTETPKEAVSAKDINMESNPTFDLEQQDLDVDKASVEGSDTPPNQAKDAAMVSAGNYSEVKLLDTKCISMLNSDMPSEAMLPESIMSGSDNLSRIHLSPESTH